MWILNYSLQSRTKETCSGKLVEAKTYVFSFIIVCIYTSKASKILHIKSREIFLSFWIMWPLAFLVLRLRYSFNPDNKSVRNKKRFFTKRERGRDEEERVFELTWNAVKDNANTNIEYLPPFFLLSSPRHVSKNK